MGIKRIEEAFAKVKASEKKAFVPYVMCGDKSLEYTKEVIGKLEEYGATLIELGVPFSDPVADGDTIQRAGLAALKNKVNLKAIFNMVKEARETVKVPLVLMSYINPIYRFGLNKFADECEKNGIDGVIIPDVPLEEFELIEAQLKEKGIAIIPIVTPTSGVDRIKELSLRGSGFLYTVTVAGVTGARSSISEDSLQLLKRVKSVSYLPVIAGFGISTKEQIDLVKGYCDGVVVGSRIVQLAEEGNFEAIKELMS